LSDCQLLKDSVPKSLLLIILVLQSEKRRDGKQEGNRKRIKGGKKETRERE
jgi:hypothetical protein